MKEYEEMMIEESKMAEELFKEMRENCPREFSNIIDVNI